MLLWLSHLHFDFSDPWEHVNFQVTSVYDVVGRQGWHIKSARQTYCELWLVKEGEVCIHLGEETATIGAPAIALLRSGVPRDTYHTGGEKLAIAGFSFDATIFGALDFVSLLEMPIKTGVEPSLIEGYLERMLDESRTKSPGYALATHGLGQLAFVTLMRELKAEDTPKIREKLRLAQSHELMGALQLVANHFDEPLNAIQMAEAAHLSPKHFGKKFGEALGMSPMEYLRKFRINHARDLLATTDYTAGKIAHDCGFEDAAYFSRIFKREFHQTPGDFRRHTRSGPPS